MNEAQPKTPLFNEFEPASADAWKARITKELRDGNYNDLLWHSEEGITVKPFYTRHDLPENTAKKPDDFPYVRTVKTRNNSWKNIQDIYVRRESKPFIDKAAEVLQKGADGVHFILKEAISFDFAYLFSKPGFIGATVHFTFPVAVESYVKEYLLAAKTAGSDLELLDGFIRYQPLDDELYDPPVYTEIRQLLEHTRETPNLYPIAINGQQFGNRGCLLTQEIAITLSAAVSVIEEARKVGFEPEKVAGRLQFQMSAGTNYFFEIAKFRATRLLWSAIVKSYGLPAQLASRLRIHVSTSRWTHTVFDPHTNLLRATTQAMSAVLGGCDSLSVEPFDKLYKTSDDFSERVARNISIILKDEAYLGQAIDPAAGSYYLEFLTKEMANQAWDFFQEIETKGGFKQALESDFLALEIKHVTEKRFKALTARESILVGTNKYPNPNEKLDFEPERLMQSKYFNTNRAGYPFEVMRLASELHFRKKKKKAKALIAVIGTKIGEHVHASFAKEFFDCANFETHVYHFDSVADAAKALENDTSKVVVLSGSEDQYERFDKTLSENIKNHVHQPVLIMAATPQHMEEEMAQKGFDQYIFQGCDIDSIINCVQKKVLLEDEPLD